MKFTTDSVSSSDHVVGIVNVFVNKSNSLGSDLEKDRIVPRMCQVQRSNRNLVRECLLVRSG